MPNLNSLVLFLLGASASLSCALLLVLFRQTATERTLKTMLLLVLLGGMAYTLLLGKTVFLWKEPWPFLIRMAAAQSVCALVIAVRILFEDDYEYAHWSLWPLLPLILFAGIQSWLPGIGIRGLTITASALGAAVFWVMLKTAKHDLDESRRRLRTLMTGIAGSYIILMTLGRWLTASLGDPQFYDLLSLMLLIAIKLLTLIRVQGQDNPIARIFNRPPPVPPPGLAPADEDGAGHIDDAEAKASEEKSLALGLVELIGSQRMYADEGMSLPVLAARLKLPEYRLRQLINGSLGFRNFNTFMNTLRLDEAANRLVSPDQTNLPILTIALDVGFGSIGPFNRSFKARYGLTPTEFRQRGKAAELTHFTN